MKHITTVLLTMSLSVTLVACQGQSKSDQPEGDYENLSPLHNESDPFAAGVPSLQGLDRTHWPVIVYPQPSAAIEHGPTYFGEVDRGEDEIDVLMPPPVTWRMAEAMSGTRPGNWSARNGLDAVGAPLRAAGHAVILPVAAIVNLK